MLELLSLATLIICIILIIRVSRLDMVLNDIRWKMENLSASKSRANEQTATQERPSSYLRAESAIENALVDSTAEQKDDAEIKTQETPTHCVQTPATTEPIATITEPVTETVIESEPQPHPTPALPIIEIPKQPEIRPTNIKTREPKNINFEKFFGTNLFGKIGILILVIGIGLFVKYAIDNEWLNETMRTVLGFAVGSALLLIGQRLSKKYRMFGSLLTGGAFAIFYVIIAVAYHYYELFSQPVALSLMIVLTILMAMLSLRYNRRELAIISLVGGFTAPFIVGGGSDSHIALFLYIAILNLGMFVLALRKRWAELPVICFGGTYLVMFIFTMLASYDSTIALELLGFATLFYLIFLLPIIYILRSSDKINKVLLSTVVSNNFIYLAFGLHFLNGLNHTVNLDGILTLFVAAANLAMVVWLMKYRADRKALIYSMLGLVLSFVSLTIPLQLEGNFITLFWATEIIVLMWLFVKSKFVIYNYFALLVAALTAISLLMDFSALTEPGTMFLNATFITNLYASAMFIVAGLLIGRYREQFDAQGVMKYIPMNIIMLSVGIVFVYTSVVDQFVSHLTYGYAESATAIFSMFYVSALTLLAGKRFTGEILKTLYFMTLFIVLGFYLLNKASYPQNIHFWIGEAVLVMFLIIYARLLLKHKELSHQEFTTHIICYNAVAIIAWVTTVSALLDQIHLNQQSAGLSISLATIAAAQMVVGMKYHVKSLRIMSVSLLLFVIAKLALYDLWQMNLAGKIVVFISFGIILLALSFLYQKLKNVLFSDDQK